MTKTELIALGTQQGDAEFSRTDADILKMNRADVVTRVRWLASVRAADAKIRSAVFHDAFVGGFMRAWDAAFDAQPEVRAEARTQYFLRRVERAIAETSAIDSFAGRFAKNPLDAFEWAASSAIENAMRRDVALRLKQIIEFVGDTPESTAAHGGVDNAIKFGIEQVMRGARYPSHSTSLMANFIAECKTMAFAELVADLDSF